MYLQDDQPLQLPVQLTALVLSPDTHPDFLRAVLGSLVRGIQADPMRSGPRLASAVVPSIIVRLSSSSVVTESGTSLIMVQILFLLFSFTPEVRRDVMLAVVLPPVCTLLTREGASSSVTQLCGKGVTHLARACPEAFKAQVASLTDSHRLALQMSMRTVLDQQSAPSSVSPGASGEGPVVKKIDISRYRKVE